MTDRFELRPGCFTRALGSLREVAHPALRLADPPCEPGCPHCDGTAAGEGVSAALAADHRVRLRVIAGGAPLVVVGGEPLGAMAEQVRHVLIELGVVDGRVSMIGRAWTPAARGARIQWAGLAADDAAPTLARILSRLAPELVLLSTVQRRTPEVLRTSGPWCHLLGPGGLRRLCGPAPGARAAGEPPSGPRCARIPTGVREPRTTLRGHLRRLIEEGRS